VIPKTEIDRKKKERRERKKEEKSERERETKRDFLTLVASYDDERKQGSVYESYLAV